jgi:hypothetical protein
MLTAVKLVNQWGALERRLPRDWETIALRLRSEQPDELPEAARILAPMTVGRVGDALAVTIRRAGGPSGPESAKRLFARLDEARIWCLLENVDVAEGGTEVAVAATEDEHGPFTEQWDEALGEVPPDWSDLLCAIDLESSALLPRAALLCAPLNPTRDPERIGFLFRCGRAGYGASAPMTRRCFERLDAESIEGSVSVLRELSDADYAATQGVVWYVGGKAL